MNVMWPFTYAPSHSHMQQTIHMLSKAFIYALSHAGMHALNLSCMLLECVCSTHSVIVHAHVYMFSHFMDA